MSPLDLPRDMLVEILSQLPIEELSASARVCKNVSALCKFPRVLQAMQRNSETALGADGFVGTAYTSLLSNNPSRSVLFDF
jgi:hypothetical protein